MKPNSSSTNSVLGRSGACSATSWPLKASQTRRARPNTTSSSAVGAQTYLVSQHNVPVYRVQIVGLGKDKPVNDEKTRDDRQKNRRVQVTVFSADSGPGTAAQSPGSAQ